VLLNLAVVVVMMIPSFLVHVLPRIPAKLEKAYHALAMTHAALGTVSELAGLYILRSAGTSVLPEKLRITKYKALYANCTGALVGGVLRGIGNLRPLVRLACISEMKSRKFEKTRLEKRRLSVVHDGRNKDLQIWFTQLECITTRRNQVRFVRRRSQWLNMK
jgi:hypothetical protein